MRLILWTKLSASSFLLKRNKNNRGPFLDLYIQCIHSCELKNRSGLNSFVIYKTSNEPEISTTF